MTSVLTKGPLLHERGWIPVSEITDEMLTAHRAAHPPGKWYVAMPGTNFYTGRPREGLEGNPLTGDRARITVAAPVTDDHVWVDIRLPVPGVAMVTDFDRLSLMCTAADKGDRAQSLYGWAADTITALRDQVDAQAEELVDALEREATAAAAQDATLSAFRSEAAAVHARLAADIVDLKHALSAKDAELSETRRRHIAEDREAAILFEQATAELRKEVAAKDDRLVAAAETIQRLQAERNEAREELDTANATSRRLGDRILALVEERNDAVRRRDAAQGTITRLLSQVDELRAQLALRPGTFLLPDVVPPPMRWGPIEITCQLIEQGK